MTLFPHWDWRSLPPDADSGEIVRHVNERMRQLQTALEVWQERLVNGPIPGGYMLMTLGTSVSAGLSVGTQDLVGISFEARPVEAAITIFGSGATVTVQINNSSTPIFVSNQSVSTGSPVTIDERVDFAVDKVVAPDLNLEIISIDAGTPIHIRATVLLKAVQGVGST